MNTCESEGERLEALARYGASAPEAAELLASRCLGVSDARAVAPTRLPLEPEPHVPFWQGYANEAASAGVFGALRRHLIPLRFPIAEGISATPCYRAAMRRGVVEVGALSTAGLVLAHPEAVRLEVHPCPAGAIPVLIAEARGDLLALVRALAMRNEPAPIPASVGAWMVSGLVNWDRVRAHRADWEARKGAAATEAAWAEEFARLAARKELYQDRFAILSGGPYSGVPAEAVGLEDAAWRAVSLTIRREHEATHYLALRLCGTLGHTLHEELVADYAGILAAVGRYEPDWAMRFLGLEGYPAYRQGGRLEFYRGNLSDGAFRVLCALARDAVEALVALDQPGHRGDGAVRLAALLSLDIFQLAGPQAGELVAGAEAQWPC